MSSLFQMDIPKRNGLCAGHAEKLKPGMEYYSLIAENENQQIIRHDFCTNCWAKALHSEMFLKKKGFWKSKVEQKKEDSPSFRLDRALTLLKDLIEKNSSDEEEIFILSVLLSRARKLLLRQEFQKDGGRWGLYEIAHQDEFLTIKILSISTLSIEDLQKKLAEKLRDPLLSTYD